MRLKRALLLDMRPAMKVAATVQFSHDSSVYLLSEQKFLTLLEVEMQCSSLTHNFRGM
jgi:hypothetical protein